MKQQDHEDEPIENESTIPVADVRQRKLAGSAASKLWWVTLLCLVLSIVLALRQLRPEGKPIVIHFDQGHGLHNGAPVRYRGIDVGSVESVVLSKEMDGVEATVILDSRADRLAREDSQFWIERPRVSLSQVGGLETVVGPKYIGVRPGPADGRPQTEFRGLNDPPNVNEFSSDGLVVILESTDRLGLQDGSPVRYRGVDVGHIMSVSLAPDAANVESRAYIRPQFRNLVRTETRFWSNSGLDLTVGLRGVQLDADTLSTIAAGGVAMATPADAQQDVASEHRFELSASAEDEWLEWQPNLSLQPRMLSNGTPEPMVALGVWRRQRFAVSRFGRRSAWVLPLDDGRVIGPADVLEPSDKGNTLEVAGQTISLTSETVLQSGSFAAAKAQIDFVSPWPSANLRSPNHVESVILVGGDSETTEIAQARLTADGDGNWQVDSAVSLDDKWHGAPAIATTDGAVIGICIANGKSATIATVPN